jgi:hypothetical protein
MSRRRLLAAAAALAAVGLLAGGTRGQEPDGDELVLREAGVAADAAALEDFFRRRTPPPDEARQLDALVRQLGDEDFVRREQASRHLIRLGPAAVTLLAPARHDPDPEVARRAAQCLDAINPRLDPPPVVGAAARLLVRKAPSRAADVLLAYLPFAPEPGIQDDVAEALAALASRPGRAAAPLRPALADRRPACRAAAARALGRSADAGARAAVTPLLADPDPHVRLAAAEGLLVGRERAAVPVLIAAVADGPPELAERAESLLLRLAGEQSPNPAGDARARRDAWARWWANNGARIDLARLADPAPYLGLTLVPEMHAGKVWECGKDGKPLWQLADLLSPIDAQVLPGQRLLVAELNGGRVTERDRHGKVLWQYSVNTPIACQRLPDGTTFIATNHQLFVVSSSGKVLSSYAPEPGFFIHSARRLPNGHTACVSMAGCVREIGAAGKVVCSVDLPITGGWSGIEGVGTDRYLVVNNTRGQVLEVDRKGKTLWEYTAAGACYASRLPNGHTLVVSNASGLLEVDRSGTVVWQREVTTSLWRAHRR